MGIEFGRIRNSDDDPLRRPDADVVLMSITPASDTRTAEKVIHK
jgi:hypothetical protein